MDDICRPEHRPHVVRRHGRRLHIVRRHVRHLHVVCSTPHGQCRPRLSSYCDRNWLLNGIYHKNVELFHFRII